MSSDWLRVALLLSEISRSTARSALYGKQKGVLAMMTATVRKTSVESKHLRNCDCFAIIPSCSHFTMLTKSPTTGLV